MPPLRNKVQPGERRILADEYNAFLAMAKRPGDGLASDGFSDFYQASRAYIKNTTAAKVEAFGVLGIDSPVITRATNNPEFFGAPTFNGVTPDIDLHAGKFAILQEPAMPGDTVRAVVAGGTWAWLNVVAEADTTAEVADGVRAYVETGTSGTAKIIWKEAGTGVRAGFIVLNGGDPDSVDVVRVYHSGSAVGADVAANASGVHPGQIKRVVAGVMTEPGECWILFVDDYGTEAGTIKAVNGDYYGPARLSGELTHASVTRPLYVLRRNFERLVHFELTGTLSLSGDAPAIILSDNDADWADTALEIQVYDWFQPEGMWAGISGYRGYALRREGTHASGRVKYDILWMEQVAQTIQFTTTEYMGYTTASQVAATVNWYDHQGKNPGATAIVRDPQNQFPDVHSGAKGTAVYDYRNGYYRIVSCQRVAKFATAAAASAFCATSSPSINSFSVYPCGDEVGAPPTTPSTASNSCGHAGLSGNTVLLRRITNTLPNPTWQIVDVTKHAKTVMTDVQVSGLTLQKKEITIYAEVCTSAAPSWVTWHTGGECPPP